MCVCVFVSSSNARVRAHRTCVWCDDDDVCYAIVASVWRRRGEMCNMHFALRARRPCKCVCVFVCVDLFTWRASVCGHKLCGDLVRTRETRSVRCLWTIQCHLEGIHIHNRNHNAQNVPYIVRFSAPCDIPPTHQPPLINALNSPAVRPFSYAGRRRHHGRAAAAVVAAAAVAPPSSSAAAIPSTDTTVAAAAPSAVTTTSSSASFIDNGRGRRRCRRSN